VVNDITQRAAELRKQESDETTVALNPIRAKYAPLWEQLQADCAAQTGHQWYWAATNSNGDAIWRCPQCLRRETRS
jgi:hypothetical protein